MTHAASWRGRRSNVITFPHKRTEPAHRYARSRAWLIRETIVLTALAAFVVAIIHLAGQAGVLAESRP
jgi:hypothetical protein